MIGALDDKMATCIVLTTKEQYDGKHERLLLDLLAEKPELLLAHGVNSEDWEEAMDMCCVMLEIEGADCSVFCNTTSHPSEDLQSVISFAEKWCDLKDIPRDIKVVYV